MPQLKLSYDSKDSIPEGLQEYYTEKNGKFVIQVDGMKTQEDVSRLETALDNERNSHKTTKQELAKYKDVDLDKWEKVKDIDPEHPPTGAGADPESAEFKKAVSDAVRKRERELKDEHASALEAKDGEVTEVKRKYQNDFKERRLRDELASRGKFTDPDKLDDFILNIKSGSKSKFKDIKELWDTIDVSEDDSGMSVVGGSIGDRQGFTEVVDKISQADIAKHYRPAPDNSGGGAGNGGDGGDGGSNNPFKKDDKGNYNRTAAGVILKKDKEEARRLAKAAGWPERLINW